MSTSTLIPQRLPATLLLAFMSTGVSAAPHSRAQDVTENPPVAANPVLTLTILHTNDIHGHLHPWQGWIGDLKDKTVGGLDRVSANVNKVRASVTPGSVLLLDAGDTIGDSMVAVETEGRAVIETMNAIGYDAMVVGNHEPDFTADKLLERIRQARFPVLAANITHRKDGELFTRAYVMREVNGVQVGILGLAYPNTALTSAQKNVEGLRFSEAVQAAREYVPRLRHEGAQIVIALTHLGLGADQNLAEKVDGIDVIVGGHSHNRMTEPLQVGQTLIVQAGAHGSDLGRLDLTIADGRIQSHHGTLIPITGNGSDKAITELIERQSAPHEQKMSTFIGTATTVIPRAQTIAGQESEKRDAESPADDLFADAIRETTGVDVAFLPGLGYGVALQPGEITSAHLRNLIPHDSAVWTLRLTGQQIREVLEQAIENFSTTDVTQKVGGMIQVSGLKFRYDPGSERGDRVKEITIGGREIVPRRHYAVAINGLLVEGGHNYEAFERGTDRREAGSQYNMVRSWIKRRGDVTAPRTDRIIDVSR